MGKSCGRGRCVRILRSRRTRAAGARTKRGVSSASREDARKSPPRRNGGRETTINAENTERFDAAPRSGSGRLRESEYKPNEAPIGLYADSLNPPLGPAPPAGH